MTLLTNNFKFIILFCPFTIFDFVRKKHENHLSVTKWMKCTKKDNDTKRAYMEIDCHRQFPAGADNVCCCLTLNDKSQWLLLNRS